MSNPIHERLERIRIDSLKKAHEAYAKACEAGMNEMVQVAQQTANAVPVEPTKEAAQ